jgi:BTB/POZ domain
MIQINVGPEREVFRVHKSILVRESTFFEGCLKHNFKESQQNEMTLEDVKPEVFLLVIRWLYIYIPQDKEDSLRHIQHLWSPNWWDDRERTLYQAYILSDRLGIERLQNHIINELRDIYRWRNSCQNLGDAALNGRDLPLQLEAYFFYYSFY